MEIGLTVFNRTPSQPERVENCDGFQKMYMGVPYFEFRFLSALTPSIGNPLASESIVETVMCSVNYALGHANWIGRELFKLSLPHGEYPMVYCHV